MKGKKNTSKEQGNWDKRSGISVPFSFYSYKTVLQVKGYLDIITPCLFQDLLDSLAKNVKIKM